MFGFGKKHLRTFATISESQTGLCRPDNQDNLLLLPHARIFGVADGMGGASEGARASAILCAHIRETLAAQTPRTHSNHDEIITHACHLAHRDILAYAHAHGYEQMGTTGTFLSFDGADTATICHIGDSRAYRIRKGMSKRLTRDHTIARAVADFAGSREKAQALCDRRNALAHILTRAIGVGDQNLRIDTTTCDVHEGDRFLLCTDGLHDVISDARLAFFVAAGSLDAARTRLTNEVLACGAPDNFSFVIVEVGAPS